MSLGIQWGDVPTWFSAVSTTGAFIAAGFAANWTAKTAKSADAQVKVVRDQAAAEREQLELAKNEAERQRTITESAEERARKADRRAIEADRRAAEAAERERALAEATELRFVKAQLDLRAPTVYTKATPGASAAASGGLFAAPFLAAIPSDKMHLIGTPRSDLSNYEVESQMTMTEADEYMFVVMITLKFVNRSNVPARIDFVNYPNLELPDIRQGQELVVPPDETRDVVVRRRLMKWQLRTEADVSNAEASFLQIEYWVRDLGMNTRDVYRFNLDARFFKRDGSRLIVEPKLDYSWREIYGSQVGDRFYERLDPQD